MTERIRGRRGVAIRKRHLYRSPLCVMCQAEGRVREATELDHIVSLINGGDNSASNKQGLCAECHRVKTARDMGLASSSRTGEDGWPIEIAPRQPSGPRWRWEERQQAQQQSDQVKALLHPSSLRPSAIPLTIVCGPAGAGKSTYVAAHTVPGDTVIDMDAIRLELGIGVEQWDQGTLIRSLRRRNELLAALATAHQGSAWFIVSEARSQERDWWRHMLHPQQTVIVLASADTCMDRIRSTRTGDRADRAIRAARRWWDNYSPAAHELEVHTDQ